jgi:hypothetical protein
MTRYIIKSRSTRAPVATVRAESGREAYNWLLANDPHCEHWSRYIIRELSAFDVPHACESVEIPGGYGAYCKHCGETLA